MRYGICLALLIFCGPLMAQFSDLTPDGYQPNPMDPDPPYVEGMPNNAMPSIAEDVYLIKKSHCFNPNFLGPKVCEQGFEVAGWIQGFCDGGLVQGVICRLKNY